MSYTRRSLQVVAFLATLVVGAASMAVIVTQTAWFKEWLRGFIVKQAGDYVNGRLSIGRLDGNLFFGVALGDVDVTVNGEKVVDVEDVSLDYNALHAHARRRPGARRDPADAPGPPSEAGRPVAGTSLI